MDNLSDDADSEPELLDRLQAEANNEAAPRAKRGRSKRAVLRAAGSKKKKAFVPPIPLEYQKTAGGYQRYKLPADTRVYKRRSFTYTEEYKDGDELPVAPTPPSLFTDTYLFQKAKRFLIDVDGDALELTPHETLVHRLATRFVRLYFGYFVRHDLSTPPTEDMVRGANASLALVFPSYRARDQKQVMAWDWPTIELSGDALAYYEGGALGQHQRDTVRLLEGALFGTHDGKDNFSKLAGTPSRFHSLTGELRTAAELLGTIIREGVLTRATEEANWVQREGLETLFEKIPSTRGKAGATTDGVEFAKGDAFDVLLFDPPEAEDPDACAEEVEVLVEGGTIQVELNAVGSFLYNLSETTLMDALREIEKTLSPKQSVFVAAAGSSHTSTTGKSKLSQAARQCVVKLKIVLPLLSVPMLKKMYKEASLPLPDLSDDKDALMEGLVGWLLPNYPYEDPYAQALPEWAGPLPEALAEEVPAL